MIKEITAQELNTENFINDKVKEIQHSHEAPLNDRSSLTSVLVSIYLDSWQCDY